MRGWGLGIFIRIGFGRSIRADRGCKGDGEACRGSKGGGGDGTDEAFRCTEANLLSFTKLVGNGLLAK